MNRGVRCHGNAPQLLRGEGDALYAAASVGGPSLGDFPQVQLIQLELTWMRKFNELWFDLEVS